MEKVGGGFVDDSRLADPLGGGIRQRRCRAQFPREIYLALLEPNQDGGLYSGVTVIWRFLSQLVRGVGFVSDGGLLKENFKQFRRLAPVWPFREEPA